MPQANAPLNAAVVAGRLANELESRNQDYAIGGAIALGYWGAPRGTIDIDVTIYLSPGQPAQCILLLQEIGCLLSPSAAADSLREHGFCRATFCEMRLDVFLPIVPFYEAARARRKRMEIAGRPIIVWDAESLVVFKMMFFRRKDLADVEQVLRVQGPGIDRHWVRDQLVAIYGLHDPRLSTWDDLARETPA